MNPIRLWKSLYPNVQTTLEALKRLNRALQNKTVLNLFLFLWVFLSIRADPCVLRFTTLHTGYRVLYSFGIIWTRTGKLLENDWFIPNDIWRIFDSTVKVWWISSTYSDRFIVLLAPQKTHTTSKTNIQLILRSTYIQGCGSGMICFGSDSGSDFQGSFGSDSGSDSWSGSCFGSGNAGLQLGRVARQTRTLFVKLRWHSYLSVTFL